MGMFVLGLFVGMIVGIILGLSHEVSSDGFQNNDKVYHSNLFDNVNEVDSPFGECKHPSEDTN